MHQTVYNTQGPVVQKPINANPRLKINHEVYFEIYPQTLFNAFILQNFRLEEVNPEKQKAAKEISTKS